MLTKQVPFTGTLKEVLDQHVHGKPVPPRHLVPSLPASVDAIVQRSLRKHPKERHQSTEEMRHDLFVELECLSTSDGSPSQKASFVLRLLEEGRVVQLTPDEEVSIGRSRTNSVALLLDESVSRRHARILCVEGQYVIEDLESRNGTFVNGRQVRRQRLRVGDLIEIGYTKLRFARRDEP